MIQEVPADKYDEWIPAEVNHGATIAGYVGALLDAYPSGMIITVEHLGADDNPVLVLAGPLGFFQVEFTQITEVEAKTYVVD